MGRSRKKRDEAKRDLNVKALQECLITAPENLASFVDSKENDKSMNDQSEDGSDRMMESSRKSRKRKMKQKKDKGKKEKSPRKNKDDIGSDDAVSDAPTKDLQSQSKVSECDFEDSMSEKAHLLLPNPADFVDFRVVGKDRALIGIPAGNVCYFKGCLEVKPIKGSLDVLGYRMSPDPKSDSLGNQWRKLYSPGGASLLGLKAVLKNAAAMETGNGASGSEEKFQPISDDGPEQPDVDETELPTGDTVILASKLNPTWTQFIQKGMNKKARINLFGRDFTRDQKASTEQFEELERTLDISIIDPNRNGARLCDELDDWQLCLTSIHIAVKNGVQPKVVATGGKGVGKSTFLRWSINRLLESFPRVLYLNFDPGQVEFGTPGYLSLTVIDKPLLGPSYCNEDFDEQKMVFLGEISVNNCPGRYLECVKQLVNWAKEHDSSLPWLVNTMGWCQGLGLLLNTDLIRLVEPSTVVQIYSRFKKKNYPVSLNPEYTSTTPHTWRVKKRRLSYSLLEFLAVPERETAKDMRTKDSWGLPDPRTLRDIQILSWLGKKSGAKNILDLPVYSIPLNKVALHICHTRVPPHGLLAAINLNLVDLCYVDPIHFRRPEDDNLFSVLDSAPLVISLGVGIVRGMDMTSYRLFVATPVSEDKLARANCLLAGSVQLPDSILMTGGAQAAGRQLVRVDEAEGEADLANSVVSYCAGASNNPLDSPWQRSHVFGRFA